MPTATNDNGRWKGTPVKKSYSSVGAEYRQDRIEKEIADAIKAIKQRGVAVTVIDRAGREIYQSHPLKERAKREYLVVKGVDADHFEDERYRESLDEAKKVFHWHGGVDPEREPEKEAPRWRSKNSDISGIRTKKRKTRTM